MTKKKIIFLVMVLLCFGTLGFLVRSNTAFQAGRSKNIAKQYHCPMHPNIVSDRQGDCPICNMRLVPSEIVATAPEKAKTGKPDPGAVCIMHECPMMKNGEKCPMLILAEKDEKVMCPVCQEAIDTQNAGGSQEPVSSAPVKEPRKLLFYRNPMRPDVTSPKPAKDEMGMDYIPVYSDEVEKESFPKDEPELPTGYASILITSERQQLIGIRTDLVEKKEAFKTNFPLPAPTDPRSGVLTGA